MGQHAVLVQVEEHFERLKSEVGIDHFEGRSWPGWHHHVTLAALTYTLIESDRSAGVSGNSPSKRTDASSGGWCF